MKKTFFMAMALLALAGIQAQAAVKLTALQIISSDASGKIQGVGAHRFRTVNHGGQPCIFVVDGDNLDGAIVNGPLPADNAVNLTLSAGTHTYSVFAEKANSSTWSYYTVDLHFDNSQTPNISALVPLNLNSTDYFPPFTPNTEFTENLQGYSVKAPGTLVYKSGQTEVKLVGWSFSDPNLYKKDRISPFEAKSNKVYDYVGQITIEVKAPPTINPGGAVNAASFTAKVAPGSLFSIFGSDLAMDTQSAAALPLPTSLNGTSVTIGGKPAPLVFVSASQINAQVPYEVVEAENVPVIVTVNGLSSVAANVSVVTAAPGIFQFGNKRAVVQNADYTVNNADNPAAAGSFVVAYLTGCGRLDNPVTSGGAAPAEPLSRPKAVVSATVNNQPADIAFAGLTPGFVGLMQINMKVPNVAAGSYPLVVTINGEKSNAAMITVK